MIAVSPNASSILTIALITTYIPQFYRIVTKGCTLGVSTTCVFLNVLFGTTQLTLVLLHSFYRLEDRRQHKHSSTVGGFRGLPAIFQIAIQWLCSIGMLASLSPLFTHHIYLL